MVEFGFMGVDLIKNPGAGTGWDNFDHIWYSHWSRRHQYSFWPSILFLLYHDCSFLEGIVWIHLLTICLRIRSINNCIVLHCQPVKVEKVKQTIRWNQSNVWLVHYHWHLWREMKWENITASANYWALRVFWGAGHSLMETVRLSCPVILGQTAGQLILNLGILVKFVRGKIPTFQSNKFTIWGILYLLWPPHF